MIFFNFLDSFLKVDMKDLVNRIKGIIYILVKNFDYRCLRKYDFIYIEN